MTMAINGKESVNMLSEFAKPPFSKFKGGEYSEVEGIVEEILGRLGCLRRNQRCVEIGASDGIAIPNTFNLMKNHEMHVLYIETEFDSKTDIADIEKEFRVTVVKTESKNVENVMEDHGMPREFVVMSIDANGLEYDIFEKTKFEPLIVIVPIDPKILPSEHKNASIGVRASFKTMNDLAVKKGYSIAAHVGHFVVYIRNNMIKNLRLKGFHKRSTDHYFDWSFLNNS
ncbi:hypothetical protein NY2A_B421L [Paramecium bursaria Chlorella virus NY2A]|uniref:Uncharacterized protein B421L n=1 Tax=Paramecium bursaria Chlorella virus NY2A TaxID=46021 RepID=A7IWU6_PBCVN|nr:hypothetical protein NY2A_B421L [Paramecium bursaria Chlorella virus NY2A]ABT14820.1 hypothetical protein NY2A_B421L [Paramecium bursaria Chlorella virus NY2A]